MNIKKKVTVRKLLSGVLVLLGFASCDSDGPGGGMAEYGTPSVDFQVKGTVASDKDEPLEGIQVIVRTAWNNNNHPYSADTVYTDAKGEFASKELSTGAIAEQKVYFNDVDGEVNGGTFKSDSIALKDMETERLKKGDNWYKGKFLMTTSVKLSEEDKKLEE